MDNILIARVPTAEFVPDVYSFVYQEVTDFRMTSFTDKITSFTPFASTSHTDYAGGLYTLIAPDIGNDQPDSPEAFYSVGAGGSPNGGSGDNTGFFTETTEDSRLITAKPNYLRGDCLAGKNSGNPFDTPIGTDIADVFTGGSGGISAAYAAEAAIVEHLGVSRCSGDFRLESNDFLLPSLQFNMIFFTLAYRLRILTEIATASPVSVTSYCQLNIDIDHHYDTGGSYSVATIQQDSSAKSKLHKSLINSGEFAEISETIPSIMLFVYDAISAPDYYKMVLRGKSEIIITWG